MKVKSLIILLLIISFLSVQVNADKDSPFSDKEWYELYKERVENICNKYTKDDQWNKVKYFIEIKEYPKIISYSQIMDDILKEYPNRFKLTSSDWSKIRKEMNNIKSKDINSYNFLNIQNVHKNNMNNIYKCAMLSVKKNSYLTIKEDLINQNVDLRKKLESKIDAKIKKIDTSLEYLKCNKSKKQDSVQKQLLLKQVTYQTCKYISYLEYAREDNKNIANLLPLEDDRKTYSIDSAINNEKKEISKINNEIKRIYKIFPLAFQAYSEYENNISIHLLLELIKEDYIIFREKLHQVINPINQVVYKISNAMKK